MGGRGMSSGISEKGNAYGSQYSTLYQSGNIKYVTKSTRDSEPLMETMTEGRVYAVYWVIPHGKADNIRILGREKVR